MAPRRPVELEDDDPGTRDAAPSAGRSSSQRAAGQPDDTGRRGWGVRRGRRGQGGRGGRGERTTVVELDDDPATAHAADVDAADIDAADADGAGEGRDQGPGRRHRGRWLVVGGAAVLVVGAVVAQHVLDERREARATRFDDVPGVLLPLDGPPRVRDDVRFEALYTPVQVGGVLLVHRAVPDSRTTARVEALDRATGDVVWRRDLAVPPALEALVREDPEPLDVTCRPLGTQAAACVVTTGTVFAGDGVDDLLVVLDATDGTVLEQRDLGAAGWTTSGTSIVTADPGRDPRRPERELWTVQSRVGTGPRAGTLEWTWTADEPLDRDAPTYTNRQAIDVLGDRILLTPLDAPWWLLDTSGALVAQGELAEGEFAALARGGVVTVSPVLGSDLNDGTLVVGDRRVEAGWVTRASVDDGTAPDVTFTVRQDGAAVSVHAWDAATGDALWDRTVLSPDPLVLDGRVYLLGAGGTVAAVDARTGEEVWSAPAGDFASWLATDGRRVLALGTSDRVRALDLDSGARVWEGTVPGAEYGLWPAGGVLLSPESGVERPALVVARP